MLMDKKIKFAVIGCGHIGKRHAEMVTRDPGAELVALCDIRPREELGIEAYDVPFFSSLTELLQSGISIDVVNVCTPNGLHAAMAIQAVETGCNVVIEKPMALTLADAEKVVYASLKYRKQVFCVMQNRYSPPSVWIKEMVDSGRLGKIYMVQLNCYWTSAIINPVAGMAMPFWTEGRFLPSSPISSTLCTGFSGISAISRLALPISTMPDLRLLKIRAL